MINENFQQKYEIGMVGLGVMGRNLLLNMSDHGFSVAGYDKDLSKVEALRQEANKLEIYSTNSIQEFTQSLRTPRAVIILVPAGAAVDSVITDLLPYLQVGDLIIDAGNSYFKDTDTRINNLEGKGIQFLGVGVSGGEEGARHGPSIMPGGSKEAYERVRLVFESAAAKVKDEPCVTYIGSGSAGHFVKMVHNGIEYAVMQLISETYDLMKRGLGLNNNELSEVYSNWNNGELSSYLIEITGHIFNKVDEKAGERLIDKILGVAKQKGTGMWTSQSAMDLQVPVPTIDVAVTMRNLSSFEVQRKNASMILERSIGHFEGDRNIFLTQLRYALYTGMIIAYAQGFEVLAKASSKYEYNLDLESVTRIWRGGCIIRAALLENIQAAFHAKKDLSNLLFDPNLSRQVMEHQKSLREVVHQASTLGIPTMGLMVSLSYLDAYRSRWLPTNLIQAQRDYFGSHTYERIDAEGTFHTEWEKE